MDKRIPGNASKALGLTLLVCGLIGASSEARATPIYEAPVTPIYDNGEPDLVTGLISDSEGQVADDFMLEPFARTITDIHWFGGYCNLPVCAGLNLPANPDNFTVRIFEDDGGVPDSVFLAEVFTGAAIRTDTGNDDADGLDIFEYSIDIDPLTLDANTKYWLSIFNDVPNDPDGGDWFWSTSDTTGGNVATRTGDGNPWAFADQKFELAFNLTGPAIPEPSAALVFGIGCLIVGGTTRRGQRR